MSYEGYTYEYDVSYCFDPKLFDIYGVFGQGIVSYNINTDDLCLLLEGITDELPPITINTSEWVSYEIGKEEIGTDVIRMTCGTHSQVYTISYTQISTETLTVDTMHEVTKSRAYYSFTPEISGSYTLTSVTVSYTHLTLPTT